MEKNSALLFKDLTQVLDKIIKVYRKLLDLVRKEKEYLLEANVAELEENNYAKESFLKKLDELEEKRILLVRELAVKEGFDKEEVRLLDLAVHFQGDVGDKLRKYHSVLVLLLTRLKDLNIENERLVGLALDNVSGAMNSIKDTLKDKATYERKGKTKDQKAGLSGNFVSREV